MVNDNKNFHNDIKKILVSSCQIKRICKRLGKQISKDYSYITFDNSLVLLGILKGCNPFMADLQRYISVHVESVYMQTKSYFGGTTASDTFEITLELTENIKDKDILIVEDIIDTGRTIANISTLLKEKGAKSVKVVTLLDKPSGRKTYFNADYVGTVVPHEFVVGYGLDYKEKYRNLNYVGVLKESVYS